MTPTRREFLRAAGAMGAGLALGGAASCAPETESAGDAAATADPTSDADPSATVDRAAAAPKRLLVLGGTGFIGPHMVRYALERGHEVTIFTRGRSDADIPDVEHLIGDRNDDHSALEGRTWDVVLDNNAQDYRWVRRSTDILADATEQYVLVSSISAYALDGFGWENAGHVLTEPAVAEDHPRIEPPAGWVDGSEAPYGLMKSLSEDIVREAFPGRATVVRPGLIVGPGDPTDRFTYWPVRLDEGGEVLAPGNPEHATQVIDQRDLTEWIVRLAEAATTGDFNATGPVDRMSMATMLDRVGSATSGTYRLTWVPEPFLQQEGLRPWSDLPAWIPGDPLTFVDVRRAVGAGLSFRPLADTARDTLEWDRSRPAEERENRAAGMSRARERDALARWHATRG